MLNKQKTREGKGAFAGSRTGDLENNRQEEGSNFLPVSQGKCTRCPNFPGKGYACNLAPCLFTKRGRCAACIHFLPVNEHRNNARCVWTGERLDAEEVERVRECIGFERRDEGLTNAGACGMVSFPNLKSHNRRLSLAPQGEKDLFSYSAIHAHTVFSVAHVHIGRVTRPVSARTGGFFKAGERVYPAFLFNPQLEEVPHA